MNDFLTEDLRELVSRMTKTLTVILWNSTITKEDEI
jgi:hypothetical protein